MPVTAEQARKELRKRAAIAELDRRAALTKEPKFTPAAPYKPRPTEFAPTGALEKARRQDREMRLAPQYKKMPSAQFMNFMTLGMAKSTYVPQALGAKIPEATTGYEKAGETVGSIIENLSELMLTAGALKAVKLMPYGYSVLSKAARIVLPV